MHRGAYYLVHWLLITKNANLRTLSYAGKLARLYYR